MRRNQRLNRLGGSEWKTTKSKVKSAVKEIARDLVELYAAKTEPEKGISMATVVAAQCEEMFPYMKRPRISYPP